MTPADRLAAWCTGSPIQARRVLLEYDAASRRWVARALSRPVGAKGAREVARVQARDPEGACDLLARRLPLDLFRVPRPTRSERQSARAEGVSNMTRWVALVRANVSPKVASALVAESTHPAPCSKCGADLRVNVEGHGPWCPACEPVPGRLAS